MFGDPTTIATKLRARVARELGLGLSIGVATTKHLAKVASQVAKPDGLVVVAPGTERAFLDPLPIGLVWGVGAATQARLHSIGVRTIGELADSSPEYLRGLLGGVVSGQLISRASNNDGRAIVTSRRTGSVGAQAACGRWSLSCRRRWAWMGSFQKCRRWGLRAGHYGRKAGRR